MNKGLVTSITAFVKETVDDDDKEPMEVVNEHFKDVDKSSEDPYELPPDIALDRHIYSDPKTLDKALRGPNTKEWQEALNYEKCQLEKLETWEVVNLFQGHTAILCSKVIWVKQGPNGEVQSYRIRIVARGHKQVEGVNYSKTFLATAKMPTVWTVLANAAHQDWEIEHINVKSTYLKAPLKEKIYMKPLRGVHKPEQEGKVLRLLKGLYGLKQAGRGWYMEMLRAFLNEMGFKWSAIDHSVFYKKNDKEHTIVAIATDDMAVTSKRTVDTERFKFQVKSFWDITNHGPINWFLGFQIKGTGRLEWYQSTRKPT
jgi:Reverse transcriptase (RNA-dependent DNA polymerase)